MGRVIAITNPYDDTRVSVIYPTDDSLVDKIVETQVDKTKEYFIMDFDDLPNDDNDYFNAWEFDRNELGEPCGVKVHLDKAREIYRNQLREDRKKEFEKLDVMYMRALERQDTTTISEIVAKKQVLRDLTTDPRIDNVKTSKELRELVLLC